MIYQKTFSEIRFPGQIDIYDGRSKIVKAFFPSKFKHWMIDNNSIIKLSQTEYFNESKETLTIDHKRILYSLEDPDWDKQFSEKLLSYQNKLISKLNLSIGTYQRIGIRNYIKVGCIDFDKFIKKSQDNFIFNKSLLDNIPFDHGDIHFTLQNDNNRLNFGPMKKDEVNHYSTQFVTKDNIDGDYLLIDIDCFENNIRFNHLKTTIDQINGRMNGIRDSLMNYFQGEIYE